MIPYLTYQPLNHFVVSNFVVLSWTLAVYHMATFVYAMWVFLGGRFAPLALEEPPARPLHGALLDAVQSSTKVAGFPE